MALPEHVNDRNYQSFRDTLTPGKTKVAVQIEQDPSEPIPITLDASLIAQILSAEDKEEAYTWLDINSRKLRRVDTITYTAVSVSPTASVIDTFSYVLAAGEYVFTGTTRVTTP